MLFSLQRDPRCAQAAHCSIVRIAAACPLCLVNGLLTRPHGFDVLYTIQISRFFRFLAKRNTQRLDVHPQLALLKPTFTDC
jgi:hypothetical protein